MAIDWDVTDCETYGSIYLDVLQPQLMNTVRLDRQFHGGCQFKGCIFLRVSDRRHRQSIEFVYVRVSLLVGFVRMHYSQRQSVINKRAFSDTLLRQNIVWTVHLLPWQPTVHLPATRRRKENDIRQRNRQSSY